MKISNYFTMKEATKTDTGLDNKVSKPEEAYNIILSASKLDLIRMILGKPVIVNSWYRSKKVNEKVGGVPTSQHALGQAIDIRVNGLKPIEIMDKIKASGVSFDQLIVYKSFVHISFKPDINKDRKQVIIKPDADTKRSIGVK